MPAVLMVLVLSVGSIMLATQRLTLSSTAAQVARLEARGDNSAGGDVIGALVMRGGVAVHRSSEGRLHCVTLTASPIGGLLSTITVSGRGCAAKSDITP